MAERGFLSGQARSVIKKGASINIDIAEAINKAAGQRPTRRVTGAET
jgi:hypothetical protein